MQIRAHRQDECERHNCGVTAHPTPNIDKMAALSVWGVKLGLGPNVRYCAFATAATAPAKALRHRKMHYKRTPKMALLQICASEPLPHILTKIQAQT